MTLKFYKLKNYHQRGIYIVLLLLLCSNSFVFGQLKPYTAELKQDGARDIYESPVTSDKVCDYPVVEITAQFPGGMDSLRAYIGSRIVYPEDAIDEGIEGRVVAEFVIEKDGSVTEIKISQKLSPSCDAEVVRLLRRMPKWLPAKLKGKAVRSIYRYPFTFRLE